MKRRTRGLFPLISFWGLLYLLCPVIVLNAQNTGSVGSRFYSLQQNSVSTLEAFGDTLWTGPGLNRWIENDINWYVPEHADSVFTGRGRIYSLALGRDTILAGIGYTSTLGGQNVQTAIGYYRSLNGGLSWDFYPFPLDPEPDLSECFSSDSALQTECDLHFTYGGRVYPRLRVTVPQQSPPFEVDFSGDTILSVNWAAGLLRSRDGGHSWEHLILPPSSVSELSPDQQYEWRSVSGSGEPMNRYDPRYDNNLLGFGLLIDSEERVWVGTAAGINISENALTATADSISWHRTAFAGDPDGLIGGWIIKIREEPGTDRIWMTNWPADPENRDGYGLVSTGDGAQTFQHFLEGVRVNDIAFYSGNIFAATDEGLFITYDNGESWEHTRQIRSSNTFIRDDARYLSAAATNKQIWIGTSDGLASSSDSGENWAITRVDFPLRGGNAYQQNAPDVNTYAYPNPFSPGRHQISRIKYEVLEHNHVRIRLFDFGMNLITTLENRTLSPGTYETTWDGRDSNGRIVDNGPLFYLIEEGNRQTSGKILLLD
jgi:hypothetical protein